MDMEWGIKEVSWATLIPESELHPKQPKAGNTHHTSVVNIMLKRI
jgi:hypothetical protein